jgi:hypothetical protein
MNKEKKMEKNMDKPRLQRMYIDFLTKEGYKPEFEEQGDIAFKYHGDWYSIEIYDEDLEFGRLCLMVKAEFDSDRIIHAYKAASEVSGGSKLSKAYIRNGDIREGEQHVVFSIGFLLHHLGDFKKYFQRMLDEMRYACKQFWKTMDKLEKDE